MTSRTVRQRKYSSLWFQVWVNVMRAVLNIRKRTNSRDSLAQTGLSTMPKFHRQASTWAMMPTKSSFIYQRSTARRHKVYTCTGRQHEFSTANINTIHHDPRDWSPRPLADDESLHDMIKRAHTPRPVRQLAKRPMHRFTSWEDSQRAKYTHRERRVSSISCYTKTSKSDATHQQTSQNVSRTTLPSSDEIGWAQVSVRKPVPSSFLDSGCGGERAPGCILWARQHALSSIEKPDA